MVDGLASCVNSLGEWAQAAEWRSPYGGFLGFESVNLGKDPVAGPLEDTQNTGEPDIG